jgi:hypothetical protein
LLCVMVLRAYNTQQNTTKRTLPEQLHRAKNNYESADVRWTGDVHP